MTIKQASGSAIEMPDRVDPITFEIVRHRLWSIADEMAMVLIRTAGNPTITEAHDFMVAMFTPDGGVTLGGWGGNRHLSCTAQACKGILARFSKSDIHEDDVYLLNDPYVALLSGNEERRFPIIVRLVGVRAAGKERSDFAVISCR